MLLMIWRKQMPDFGMTFHHMGLAVRQEDQAINFLEGMDYRIGDKIYDPEQNVHLRLCTALDKPAFELIMQGIGDGPLDTILKHTSEIIYHTCYETDCLDKTLSALEATDLRVFPIVPPKPALLFGNRKVSFYQVMGFGFIELLESA